MMCIRSMKHVDANKDGCHLRVKKGVWDSVPWINVGAVKGKRLLWQVEDIGFINKRRCVMRILSNILKSFYSSLCRFKHFENSTFFVHSYAVFIHSYPSSLSR